MMRFITRMLLPWLLVTVSDAFCLFGGRRPATNDNHNNNILTRQTLLAISASTATNILKEPRNKTRGGASVSSSFSSVDDIQIIFSDVDGSLLHYPKDDDNNDNPSNDYPVLALPPSATGLRGIISHETLRQCRDLRRQGVKLVLVSGMRTSTLLNRLPFLPRADAYCSESGGRIFYPTLVDDDDDSTINTWTPLAYEGATLEDLQPFGLREDPHWRARLEMSDAAGMEGYAGNEVFFNRCDGLDNLGEEEECLIDYDNIMGFSLAKDVVPVPERTGLLWEFAQVLQEKHHLVLDTQSYSTCFRVNLKHQSSSKNNHAFQELLDGTIDIPSGLQTSVNLGCIDVYPVDSGKKNCCAYIANLLDIDMGKQSVCVCDDDNDIEMAMAVATAYLPACTSLNLKTLLQQQPNHFVTTFDHDNQVTSTKATDQALKLISKRVAAATTGSSGSVSRQEDSATP